MGDLTKDINSKFDNEWVKALINIKYTSAYLDKIADKILKPYNISEPQYNILTTRVKMKSHSNSFICHLPGRPHSIFKTSR